MRYLEGILSILSINNKVFPRPAYLCFLKWWVDRQSSLACLIFSWYSMNDMVNAWTTFVRVYLDMWSCFAAVPFSGILMPQHLKVPLHPLDKATLMKTCHQHHHLVMKIESPKYHENRIYFPLICHFCTFNLYWNWGSETSLHTLQ